MSRELLLVVEAALGGIGIFLLGMRFLSDGLQALAGARLHRWIASVADNRLLALLVGIGVTCVIQSSTATTVMVVGFVNSGVMTLLQGVAVVFGANVGTTLSLWLLTLNVSEYGEFLIGVAIFFYLFSKREKVRSAAMAAARSARPKTAEPATRTLAPAAFTSGAVDSSMPPSTSSSQAGFLSSIQPRMAFSLGIMSSMKPWPPKPGSTVITRIRSQSSR